MGKNPKPYEDIKAIIKASLEEIASMPDEEKPAFIAELICTEKSGERVRYPVLKGIKKRRRDEKIKLDLKTKTVMQVAKENNLSEDTIRRANR